MRECLRSSCDAIFFRKYGFRIRRPGFCARCAGIAQDWLPIKHASRTAFKVCWAQRLIPVSVPVLFNGCGRNWLSNLELNPQDRVQVDGCLRVLDQLEL